MKYSRSGSRGPYHWGGYGAGDRDHIYSLYIMYIFIYTENKTHIYIYIHTNVCIHISIMYCNVCIHISIMYCNACIYIYICCILYIILIYLTFMIIQGPHDFRTLFHYVLVVFYSSNLLQSLPPCNLQVMEVHLEEQKQGPLPFSSFLT